MKLIIAGGRDYVFTHLDYNRLTEIHQKYWVKEVVSGGARGADKEGEGWADLKGIPVKRFPARWEQIGKAAGHHRNSQMACYADALAVFPGGKGTANMVKQAREQGLQIFDFREGPGS